MLATVANLFEAPRVPLGRRDAIVVLGAPPGRVLDERIAAARELFRAGGAPLVIATGRGEAEVVAAAFDTPVVIEPHARTTADNARLVAALLPPGASVWLVTHPFHTRRAVYLFTRVGLDPAPWPATDRRRLRWYLRETGAWAKVLLATAARARSRARRRCRRAS